MRIRVTGETTAARTLRGYLRQAGYEVGDTRAAYRVTVEEGAGPNIVVDGISCPLKEEAERAIAELTETRIEFQRAGGVQSDRALRVVTTGRAEDDDAVERGLLRALLLVTGHGEEPKGWRRWISK